MYFQLSKLYCFLSNAARAIVASSQKSVCEGYLCNRHMMLSRKLLPKNRQRHSVNTNWSKTMTIDANYARMDKMKNDVSVRLILATTLQNLGLTFQNHWATQRGAVRWLCPFNIIFKVGALNVVTFCTTILERLARALDATVTSAHLGCFCFQVIFDAADGATPASLRQFVSRVSDIPLDQLNMAKYFREKYDWLPITDSLTSQVCQT